MRLVINKIETFRQLKKINQRELAEMIEMTQTGYSQMIKNNDIKISVLEKIAEIFQVPITDFFSDNIENNGIKQLNENGDNIGQLIKGTIKKQQTVHGNVTIHAKSLEPKDVEIEKLNEKISALTDKLLEKDTLLEERQKFLEEREKFLEDKKNMLDMVLAGKDVQIARIIEDKEKQISYLERMIEMYKERK